MSKVHMLLTRPREKESSQMVKILNGWIYLRPPAEAGSRWDIPRRIMRKKAHTLIGKPVQLEHLGTQKVGKIIDAKCLDSDGSVRITYEIDDSDVLGKTIIEAIEKGNMRGLSLTHEKRSGASEEEDDYELKEVSITRSPKREATFCEDGIVSCSTFEFDMEPFDNAEYIHETEAPPSTDVAMETTPAPAPAAAPVPAATPEKETTPVAVEPAKEAADTKMADPSVVNLIDVPLDALGTVFNTEAKQEDRAAAFEMVTDVVSDRARLAAELKRAEEEAKEVAKLREEVARLKEIEKSSLTKDESRKYWAMQVAFMEQNPREIEAAKHARAVLNKYINSPELNEKMKTAIPIRNAQEEKVVETVKQTMASQVTRGDQSSNMEFQRLLAEKKRTIAQTYATTLERPAPVQRQPVAVVVEANSMSEVVDRFTAKQKKQQSSKRTAGPFTSAMLRHYGEIARKTVNNLATLDVVECNDFVHKETRNWLTPAGAPFAPRNMEDAQGVFALGVLVNANARYNEKSCNDLVQCSDILNKFLNDEERDVVNQSSFSQAAEMSQFRPGFDLEVPQIKRLGETVHGGMDLACRQF